MPSCLGILTLWLFLLCPPCDRKIALLASEPHIYLPRRSKGSRATLEIVVLMASVSYDS